MCALFTSYTFYLFSFRNNTSSLMTTLAEPYDRRKRAPYQFNGRAHTSDASTYVHLGAGGCVGFYVGGLHGNECLPKCLQIASMVHFTIAQLFCYTSIYD